MGLDGISNFAGIRSRALRTSLNVAAVIASMAIGLSGCGGGGGGASSLGGLPPVSPTSTPAPVLTPQIAFTSDSSVVLPRVGSSYQFSATVQNSSGGLVWSSSNSAAVSVDGTGKVTALVSVGSAIITVSAANVQPAAASVVIAQPTTGTIIVPSADVVSQTSSQVILKSDSVTSNIVANDLVVSGDKGGLLAKVLSVRSSGGQVVLQVGQTSLPEAFQQIAIDDYGPSQNVSIEFSGRSVLMKDRWGRTMRVASTNGLQCKSTDGSTIDATASLTSTNVNATMQAHRIFKSNGLSIQEFEVAATLTVSVDVVPGSLEVRGAVKTGFTCAVELKDIPVAPLPPFGPVVLSLAGNVQAGLQGTLTSSGAVSITSPTISRQQSVTVGLHYLNGSFVQIADGAPAGSVTMQPWSAALGVSIDGDVGPFAGVGLGVDAFLGPFQLLHSEFAYANLYGKLTFDIPVVPLGSSSYAGPSWAAAIGLGAGLEADVSAGKLQPFLDKLHISPLHIEFNGITVESTLLKNPVPTVSAVPDVLASGSATFSSTLPCSTLICVSTDGSTLHFIGFKNGADSGQRLVTTTVSGRSGTATWTPSSADDGSWTVAAYLYDNIFGAIGLPYASDPSGKARVSVNISPPSGSPTPVPPASPTPVPPASPTPVPPASPTPIPPASPTPVPPASPTPVPPASPTPVPPASPTPVPPASPTPVPPASPTPVPPSVSSITPTAMLADGQVHTLQIFGSFTFTNDTSNVVQFMWTVPPRANSWNPSDFNPSVHTSSEIDISMRPGPVTDTFNVRVCRSASQSTAADCSSDAQAVRAVGIPANTRPGTTTPVGPTQPSRTVTLNWDAVSGATGYGVGVRDEGTKQLVVSTTVSTNSYTAALSAGRQYRWNVTSCLNGQCLSNYTTPLYFQTP
jgi:hypothetical protein